MTDVPPFTIGMQLSLCACIDISPSYVYIAYVHMQCACVVSPCAYLTALAPVCVSLDAPKYDQSTYYGRWRQFVELVSPRCWLYLRLGIPYTVGGCGAHYKLLLVDVCVVVRCF